MIPTYYVYSRTENQQFDVAGTIVKTMSVRVFCGRAPTIPDEPSVGCYSFAETDPVVREALILTLPFSEWGKYPPGKKLQLVPLEE